MRNLQSDIDISVWHTKNINTTVKNDPQALSVNVFDHSELELLQRQKCQLFSRCRSAFLYLHHRAAEILMEGCKVVNCITSHHTCSGVSSRGVSYYGNDLVNLSYHKCIFSWSPSLHLWWCHLYRRPLQGWPCSHFTSVAATTSSSQDAWADWSGSWCERGRSGQNTSHQCCSHLCRGRFLHTVSKPHIPSERGLNDWRITRSK